MKAFIFILSILLLQGCATQNKSSEMDPQDLVPDPPSQSQPAVKKKRSNKEIVADSCLENRMSLDIGSGSTKVLVAEVNTCLQLINKVYFKDSQSIKVKESLQANNEIPNSIVQELEKTISGWKRQHENLKIKTYKGVATAVFRQAKNGADVIKKISEELKIPIQLIDQNREAQLGFYSAVAQSPFKIQDILVWDIGGGSMQMTAYLGKSQFVYHQGQTASVNFKEQVVQLKFPNIKSNLPKSPNPIGPKVSAKAVSVAQKIGQATIEDDFKRMAHSKKIIGIGGVLAKSVYRQVNDYARPKTLESSLPGMKSGQNDEDEALFFTENDLDNTLKRKALLSDAQLGGEYPETDVSNIALVLGFMKALDVKKVYIVNADLTYGVIL